MTNIMLRNVDSELYKKWCEELKKKGLKKNFANVDLFHKAILNELVKEEQKNDTKKM